MSGRNGQKVPKQGRSREEAARGAGGSGKAGAGVLHVVATPVGNLRDLSERARETLAGVDAVLCEDTRHSLKLLSHLGISVPLERLDQHATEGRVAHFAALLEQGKSFALVSDAGTPAISDPGSELVAECHRRGIRVVPVPGPSAVVALLSVAGFQATEFSFLGFAPRAEKELLGQLERIRRFPLVRTWVWFESPHRVLALLDLLASQLISSRVSAGKELTKIHEAIYHGSSSSVASEVREHFEREGEKGEWVVAIEIDEADLVGEPSREEEVKKILRMMMNAGVSASQAAREVSQSFGVKRNLVYDLALSIERDEKR